MDDPRRRPIKTLSLFSGAGGLDIGFHMAGYDIVACVEIDPHYARTLEANKGPDKVYGPSAQVFAIDVRRFDAHQFTGAGIECIIGGPPCQTFSAAGRRSGGVLGTSDARGRLFLAYCHILDIIKPQMFVFENVYGLPGANDGGPWREIVQAFQAHGYKLRADVLDAADYGVPQHRERLVMVGYREGEFEFPLPTHGPDSASKRPLVSAGEALADITDPREPAHDDLGGLYGHLLPQVPPGLNYAFFTREMGYPAPIFAWRSKFHDFLYKVDPKNPCRTIKAKPGKFTGPFHWKNRHFNVEELKRLQSFPDAYKIEGSYGKVVEQIGNSVPPLMAKVIAVAAREQLIDRVASLTYPLRDALHIPTFRQRQRERTNHFKSVAKHVVAERFGHAKVTKRRKRSATVWHASYEGFFGKTIHVEPPGTTLPGRHFRGEESFSGDDIELSFVRVNGGRNKRRRIKFEIGGLREGLTDIKTLVADCSLADFGDVFFAWDAIQDVLIRHSKFLTLIDIYGHYANRGDTVKIRTDIIGGPATTLVKALRFIGDSANCGVAMSRVRVTETLGIADADLSELITDLRAMRFDIRSRQTHPTMAGGVVLCTYPFPLLSGKAHLERRLKAESFEPSNVQYAERSLFD